MVLMSHLTSFDLVRVGFKSFIYPKKFSSTVAVEVEKAKINSSRWIVESKQTQQVTAFESTRILPDHTLHFSQDLLHTPWDYAETTAWIRVSKNVFHFIILFCSFSFPSPSFSPFFASFPPPLLPSFLPSLLPMFTMSCYFFPKIQW